MPTPGIVSWAVLAFVWTFLALFCVMICNILFVRRSAGAAAPAVVPAISLNLNEWRPNGTAGWSAIDDEIQRSVRTLPVSPRPCDPPSLYLVCVNPDDSVEVALELPKPDIYMCKGVMDFFDLDREAKDARVLELFGLDLPELDRLSQADHVVGIVFGARYPPKIVVAHVRDFEHTDVVAVAVAVYCPGYGWV